MTNTADLQGLLDAVKSNPMDSLALSLLADYYEEYQPTLWSKHAAVARMAVKLMSKHSISWESKHFKNLKKKFSYKKKWISLSAEQTCHLYNQHWDGGSRSEYTFVYPKDWGIRPCPVSPWNAPEGKVEHVPGQLVIETGFFCGKPSTMRVRGLPMDLAALLFEEAKIISI